MNDLIQKGIGKDINRESLEAFCQEAKRHGYAFIGYEEARDTPRFVIMRHDVDVDLHYAKELAELEASHGVGATYFVMLRNPLYNLFAPQSSKCLKIITGLGHQVGLHFDVSAYPDLDGPALLEAISHELAILKELAGASQVSKCVTFHKPSPHLLNTEISTDEFFSGYNRSFFRDIRYIADSGGNWREESMLDLIRAERSPKIQFNSHPVWWIAPGRTQAEKLAALLKHRAANAENDLACTINDPSRGFILYHPSSQMPL
jgi:hypothetical protein